jgi:hypothetical protein
MRGLALGKVYLTQMLRDEEVEIRSFGRKRVE